MKYVSSIYIFALKVSSVGVYKLNDFFNVAVITQEVECSEPFVSLLINPFLQKFRLATSLGGYIVLQSVVEDCS
jgi:hypothetical protein